MRRGGELPQNANTKGVNEYRATRRAAFGFGWGVAEAAAAAGAEEAAAEVECTKRQSE